MLLNGHAASRAPHILNAGFEGIEGESLFAALPGLVLSTGSACNSRSAEPSFVLRALGRDTELAQSSLRFSLGRGTTGVDIDLAVQAVRAAHAALRGRSPARPLPLEGWSGDGAELWWLRWCAAAGCLGALCSPGRGRDSPGKPGCR